MAQTFTAFHSPNGWLVVECNGSGVMLFCDAYIENGQELATAYAAWFTAGCPADTLLPQVKNKLAAQ